MAARAVVVAIPETTVPGLPEIPEVAGDAREVLALLHTNAFDAVAARPDGCTVDELTTLLADLRTQTAPGDLGLFYFSGHGYRVRDTSGDEWDGWDECLVLSDGLLPDDWFHDRFWPHIHDDTKWVTCIDTCFSGSMMRGLGGEDPPIPIVTVAPRRGSWRIDLAATREGEAALVLEPSDPGFGLARSYATTEILRELSSAPGATYRDLWDRVERRAREFRKLNVDVGTPMLRYSATDDTLLDSRAFAPLDW